MKSKSYSNFMGCFASLTREKLFENLRAKRLDPFFKINIDEGQGAEIEQKLAVLMQIATLSIAPMFSWFFPTPLRTNPYWPPRSHFSFILKPVSGRQKFTIPS